MTYRRFENPSRSALLDLAPADGAYTYKDWHVAMHAGDERQQIVRPAPRARRRARAQGRFILFYIHFVVEASWAERAARGALILRTVAFFDRVQAHEAQRLQRLRAGGQRGAPGLLWGAGALEGVTHVLLFEVSPPPPLVLSGHAASLTPY